VGFDVVGASLGANVGFDVIGARVGPIVGSVVEGERDGSELGASVVLLYTFPPAQCRISLQSQANAQFATA